jgi:hypothetical protein
MNNINDHEIKCWVLMGTPSDEVIKKAVSSFSEHGYFVEEKDILEEYDCVNPYDHLMASKYWLKLK